MFLDPIHHLQMKKFNLIIVDDHSLFRDGLKLLLKNHFSGVVITEASDGQQFLNLLPAINPDIVLIDINMPVMDGIEATKRAIASYPELKIIALSMFGDEAYYYKMIDAGVKGFLLKNSEINEVTEAIEAVLDGDNYFSKELLYNVVKNLRSSGMFADNKIDLSEREVEILELICQGFSNQEIGEKLFISKRTVDKHRANILTKTNSRNSAQLVMNAIKNKWILV